MTKADGSMDENSELEIGQLWEQKQTDISDLWVKNGFSIHRVGTAGLPVGELYSCFRHWTSRLNRRPWLEEGTAGISGSESGLHSLCEMWVSWTRMMWALPRVCYTSIKSVHSLPPCPLKKENAIEGLEEKRCVFIILNADSRNIEKKYWYIGVSMNPAQKKKNMNKNERQIKKLCNVIAKCGIFVICQKNC